MVLTNYYLRVTPFTNPDVADKLQLKPFKKSQPFRSTTNVTAEADTVIPDSNKDCTPNFPFLNIKKYSRSYHRC